MPSVGMGELLLILTIAVIAVGPERLPELARQARRLITELRQLATGVTEDLKRELDPARAELTLADLKLHDLRDLPPEVASLGLAKVPAGLHISGQLPPLPDTKPGTSTDPGTNSGTNSGTSPNTSPAATAGVTGVAANPAANPVANPPGEQPAGERPAEPPDHPPPDPPSGR